MPIVLPHEGRLALQRDESSDVGERLRFRLLQRDAVGDLLDQPRCLVHLGDEVVHVREGRVVRADHDLKAGVDGAELEIGDDDGDLDEFIDRQIESRHLAVDPHETIVLGRRYHAAILSTGPTSAAGRGTVDARLRSSGDRAGAF